MFSLNISKEIFYASTIDFHPVSNALPQSHFIAKFEKSKLDLLPNFSNVKINPFLPRDVLP